MCGPEALLGMQAAGTGMSAIGGYFSAKSQKYALAGQAVLDDVNARMSELSAKSALLAGQRSEQNARLKNAALKSTQINNLAANNIDLTEGSARNILLSTDILGEIEANDIAADAISAAWGYRTQGMNYSASSTMKRAQAGAINPLMQAGGTLLTGASEFAMNKYILTKYGAMG